MTSTRSLISLAILFCTFLKYTRSCDDTCPRLGGWNSMITIGARRARSIYVTWTADAQSSLYVVQYRLRNTQVYTSSLEISSTFYNITQLSPETDYEVQVCRATSTSSNDDCGNCLFCISTIQAQEPPSPPAGVQVRADSSESITVLWDEPELTNGVIRNYSVLCFHNESGVNIINETVPTIRPVTEFFLEPSSTYSCSVIANNDYGPSPAKEAEGTTLPVTTVPSLLLVVYANGIEYAELTASAIQSRMLSYHRLLNTSEDAKIKGLDYHFYRKEVYMTQNNHCVARFPVILDESTQLNSLRRTADPEVLFNQSAALGSITVDWVNNELYWVEQQIGYRIMRAIIDSDGSVVGPFCVVKFTTTIVTHLAIDPIHGYLYWSGSTAIYRVSLNSVRLNSTLDSCASDISSKVPLINNTQLETFTLEPNEAIYYIGYDSCFETSQVSRTNRSILGTTLNVGETRVYTGIANPVVTTDSFDRTLFSAIDDSIIAVETSQVATCPVFPSIRIFSAESPVLIVRTYRSVKQPLPVPPGPPTDIFISSTSTEANVTWREPPFIGEFFSEGAFSNWIYILKIRAVADPPGSEDLVNTSALTFLFENLQPETLYEIVLSASGPGGNQTAQDKLVFSTKSADSANFFLLVATETGVFSTKINGSSTNQIGGMLSIESNGVAYDSYTGHFYWSVEGGQGRIYTRNSTRNEDSQALFSSFRRNPFSLKLDWVARRLFWVEDGATVRGPKYIVSGSLEDPLLSPSRFAEVDNIQATVLDSLNGLLFWANESSIHAITLSGLVFEPVCYTVSPGASPFGFAVDAKRHRLYWLNNHDGGHLAVNQLEYTSTACKPNSIVAQDVIGLSFSSSSTVMAYAGDNLFIGSLSSSRIYTIASDLSNVGDGQVVALGTIQLSTPTGEELRYRDLTIISESLQTLPDTLRPTDRQRHFLTPSIANSPPRLSDRATSLETIIEWDGSSLLTPIRNTPVYYVLLYSHSSLNEVTSIISNSTSVILEGIPPETIITARVIAYSLWYQSDPTQCKNISSRPALPGTVSNIRAYVYRPTRGTDDLTALVLWDEPEFVVSNYIVSMFQNDERLFPPLDVPSLFLPDMILYQSSSTDTHYIVSARDFENRVNYFLTSGTSYKLQITANNPSGMGAPSQMYTLNVIEPNYPQNFVIVNETGVHLAGIDADLNHALPVISRSPLAIDTISRFVYWYHESPKSIARQSLNSGSKDIHPYLLLPDDTVLLAMAFEWVGMDLYFMVRDGQNNLKIMKVSTVNRDLLMQVGPTLQEHVSPTAQIKMAVDPFGGYLHWLLVNSTGTSLHQIDLRNTSSSSRLIVQSRMGLSTDLMSLNLSSALLLDPLTGYLLLSDVDSGDIVNCSVVDSICVTLISANTLEPQLGCDGTGLPAHSIALNEHRLYWIGGTSSCIFAIELNDPANLLLISNNSAFNILTLSPGQQPLPTQDCLSPNVIMTRDRPDPDIIMIQNTSVALRLMAPPLDEHCNDLVISFPPIIFGINVENGDRSIPGFPISTFDMEYTIDGLRPFTEYEVELSISNMYTLRRSYLDVLFSSGRRFTTTEGVPDPPTGVSFFVFGTADIQITWTMPNRDSLRGRSQTFYVKLFSNDTFTGEIQVDQPSVLVNASVGVVSGRTQDIAVIVSNYALNSTETRIQVTPWPLIPQPLLMTKTNTSITVKIVLDDVQTYEPVTNVSVQICTSEGTDRCNCNHDQVIYIAPFKPVDNSTQPMFELKNLEAHILHCVQSIGVYSVIEGYRAEPEVTSGESISIQTDAGVPDPPNIRLRKDMEDILEWDVPFSRGSDIFLYTVEAMRNGAPTINPVKILRERDQGTHVDLSRETELIPEVVYSIRVFATNTIGESNSSNVEVYTRLQQGLSQELGIPEIFGISVGGIVFIVIICVIIIIAFSISCHLRKKELTSLSYMYGPDHELSNLRDAYRHAHANNPHYTWSRDDYVCTDEEIELLNKFPRQSLKLETFIDRGEFGEVYQGSAMDILGPETGPTPVAVKTLRKGTTYDEQRKFLSEASLMSKFNHPNIVKVLGVCVDNDPVYIIMELMPAGDLLKFLRDAKRDHGPALLTLSEQIQIALDVAQGCRYLEQQHYIHRDIAARNCLVSSKGADRVVKIGDFGLARDLYSSDYYQVEGQRKLPVRWMAPEALLQGKFTTEADIWSYGVLLWEIMTLGNQPYPGRINQEVLQYVTGGGRLDRPEKCPGKIYHLMQSCWKRYSSERPHFDQIVNIVSNFLGRIKRPGSIYYSDSESDDGEYNLQRQPSGKMPSRTPSIRSGILNLARTGSMKLRNSFRRHGSIHRRDEHAVSQFSDEGQSYRERGPF